MNRSEQTDAVLQNIFQEKARPSYKESSLEELYDYALFPMGKMLRARLSYAIFEDLFPREYQKLASSMDFLALAIETHHTYTLLHDDLPCMDDDDMRRGKPSAHKAFGEWQALLGGDALLNLSYEFLALSRPHHGDEAFLFFSKSLGPHGLIEGQALDLSGKISESFEDALLTHSLKTGRLFQVALIAPLFLSSQEIDRPLKTRLQELGHSLGICFQLTDDLLEHLEGQVSEKEHEKSPLVSYPDEFFKALEEAIINVKIKSSEMPALQKVLRRWPMQIKSKFNEGDQKALQILGLLMSI